jgi:hypothetical protein
MDDMKYYTRPNLFNDGTDTDIYYIGKYKGNYLYEYSYNPTFGLANHLVYDISMSAMKKDVLESMTHITKEEYESKLNCYKLQNL